MRQKFRYPCVAAIQEQHWREKGEVWDSEFRKWVKFEFEGTYVQANIAYQKEKNGKKDR